MTNKNLVNSNPILLVKSMLGFNNFMVVRSKGDTTFANMVKGKELIGRSPKVHEGLDAFSANLKGLAEAIDSARTVCNISKLFIVSNKDAVIKSRFLYNLFDKEPSHLDSVKQTMEKAIKIGNNQEGDDKQYYDCLKRLAKALADAHRAGMVLGFMSFDEVDYLPLINVPKEEELPGTLTFTNGITPEGYSVQSKINGTKDVVMYNNQYCIKKDDSYCTAQRACINWLTQLNKEVLPSGFVFDANTIKVVEVDL